MALDLTQPAPPVILSSYPGVARAEQAVWDRFITSENNIYLGFFYNVRVGEAPPSPEGVEDNFAKMWLEINQTRLDALGMTEENLIVFEIKVSAGLSAIGQAIGGRILTEIESDDPRPIKGAIVSNGIRPDVVTVARALDIQTFVL